MLVLAPNDKNGKKLAEILRRDGCFKLNHPMEFMRLTLTYEDLSTPLLALIRVAPKNTRFANNFINSYGKFG